VSFPVQTLVKTSKMMPVMIWGTWMMGKKYELRDYLVAAAVMTGCSVFLLTGDVTVHSRRSLTTKTHERTPMPQNPRRSGSIQQNSSLHA
jgi:hypothetical protein